MVDRLTYVLAVTATVLAWLFFKSELSSSFANLKSSLHDFSKTSTFTIVVVPFLIILPGILLMNLKSEQTGPNPRWTQPISREHFEGQAREYTQAQLQELYKSPKFKEMMRKRGNDPKKWCWQSKPSNHSDSE